MAQPSQAPRSTSVVAGRISTAQFMSLDQELADREIPRAALVADLVLTWLNAATGRGQRCTCPDCPGNMRTMRRRYSATESMTLFEEISA